MIIIFSGPSGAGKSTVIKALIASHKDFELMPTVTSRAPRPGESEGDPYHFVTREEFLRLIDENEFYEYQPVHSGFYGTSRRILAEKLSEGKVLLKDIDVLGTMELKKCLKDVTEIITVYMTVDAETLKERLTLRGDREEDIELRLSRMEKEEAYAAYYDYKIVNRELSETIKQMEEIIAERITK